MSLNVVITMAGRGSRFYEAGYTVPKYEIMAHGRSLFDWSMLSLKNFLVPGVRLVFVCLKENNSSDYVRHRCDMLGLRDVRIIELDQVTDGQATSAYVSREQWLAGGSLLIYNIDTYVNPSVLKPGQIQLGSDGWVPCFQVPGDHWSFVKLGESGWATDLAEKKRISDFASIGLYWFSDEAQFSQAYDCIFSNSENLVGGERYIAPLYRKLVADGKKVSISNLPVADVHVLGTPRELNEFLVKDPSLIGG